MADQSWRSQPRRMSSETVALVAQRVATHAAAHDLPVVQVVLHGGEPLLAGARFLASVATTIRAAVASPTTVEVSMQTNGVLLRPATLDLLAEHAIGIGVSIDGSPADHDRHRRYADGRPSYQEVETGLRVLGSPVYRHLYRGLLCTIDLDADPVSTYRDLAAFSPPALDLLLPHGNWSSPPPGLLADSTATPYADWLIAVFDHWYASPSPRPGVRIFEEIIHLLLGGASQAESVGLSPSGVIVIETDGSIEQVDALKSAYEGAAATGLHVAADDFDAALLHPAIATRQSGLAALALECQQCRFVQACGGGYYPHRYRKGSGFANPSVYCADLISLIAHILRRLKADLAPFREGNDASRTDSSR